MTVLMDHFCNLGVLTLVKEGDIVTKLHGCGARAHEGFGDGLRRSSVIFVNGFGELGFGVYAEYVDFDIIAGHGSDGCFVGELSSCMKSTYGYKLVSLNIAKY